MNVVWTVLNGGREPSSGMAFGRRTNSVETAFDEDAARVVESLFSHENEQYRCFLVEIVTRLCWNSPLKKEFETLDPVNTYDNGFNFLRAPEYGVSPAGLPMTIIPLLTETDASVDVDESWTCVVSSGGTIRVDDDSPVPLNMVNGLSDAVELGDSLTLRLQGTPTDFSFSAFMRRIPFFSVLRFLAKLEAVRGVSWKNPRMREIWRGGQSVERVAAFIHNLVGRLSE